LYSRTCVLGFVFRLLDRLSRGPEVRRLQRRVWKLETASKRSRANWELEHASLKRQSASQSRRVLDPDIVRDLLPLRAATVSARASGANAAVAEARLIDASAAYRDGVMASNGFGDALVRTDLQGLTWWVPVGPSVTGAARERVLVKQRFPYRNITQARELAVGAIMLDIGANTGRMSIPRVILGDFVRAYCAEPDPLNYAALVRNVTDNALRGLVLPDRVAIGAANGTANLHHAKYSGGHRLVAGDGQADTIQVPCVRLDDWCERLGIDPQLVSYGKVDTQGWELEVLRGAPRLLAQRHIAWQLEVSPPLLAAAGASAALLFEQCARHFTHFIDLGKTAEGPRARGCTELSEALQYIEHDEAQTDLIFFNAAVTAE